MTEYFFRVPLDYSNPASGEITLFARSVRKHEPSIIPRSAAQLEAAPRLPFLAFLEGGPGFGNREPQDHPITRNILNRGYQILFLDYRGVGLSTPINAQHILSLGDAQAQADYLKHFRADNNVRDCEAVRKYITAPLPVELRPWSILGQSFGGFVSLSYLSMHPEGLNEVFTTGGLAPILRKPDEVYRATFKKVVERNQAFYRKYPEDVDNVHRILTFIAATTGGGVPLPSGGLLTRKRFLSLGLSFGGHSGIDNVHSLVHRLTSDLDQFGFLTRASLAAVEQSSSLDSNPVYAVLHEAIYCSQPGVASNWAAERVAGEVDEFAWVRDEASISTAKPAFFSGEMIFPFHFETQPELRELRAATEVLAGFDGWERLYDVDRLRGNKVPVFAASYIEDMYVDFELARETAGVVAGIKVFETNVMYHNALRSKTEELLDNLFRLRDDSID